MDYKDMSNEEFIQKILIEEIGEIKDKHPYLMCMLVSQGIEFLGKTLRPINNASGWNENQNAKRDFQSAIKLLPSLRKYAEIDIYQRIRCRFCEKMVTDDNMVSDDTTDPALTRWTNHDANRYSLLPPYSTAFGLLSGPIGGPAPCVRRGSGTPDQRRCGRISGLPLHHQRLLQRLELRAVRRGLALGRTQQGAPPGEWRH